MSWQRPTKTEEKLGSQKEPIAEAVTSKFGHVINPGDPVVTFAQCGRSTAIGEGIFRGTMNVKTYYQSPGEERRLSYDKTYYIVERPDGTRTKLHFTSSFCRRDIKLEDLIGHTV